MLSITINVTWRTIMGALFLGAAVATSSLTIVRAEHVIPDKDKTVYNCSAGTACLTGDSSASHTLGIHAVGTGTGLQGETSTTQSGSGVAGISTATKGHGHGVYGKSSNGEGVYGTSSTASGVYGTSSAYTASSGSPVAGVVGSGAYGVYGTSTSAEFYSGVYGKSGAQKGIGVEGYANGLQGVGVYAVATSDGNTALFAQTGNYTSGSAADIFDGTNAYTGADCTIDQDANETCTGTITGGTLRARQRSNAGRHVLTYSSQSATPTIEDLGAAQMHNGIATVEIPADFASVVDRSSPYYVFLTPMGDTRGLYVAAENAAGFQVRENMHGRSNAVFQYRIVGVPLGAKKVRLPAAPDAKVRPLQTLAAAVH